MISQSGQILIPSSAPAFLIIEFINRRAAEAKLIRQNYLEYVGEDFNIIVCSNIFNECQNMLSCISRLILHLPCVTMSSQK